MAKKSADIISPTEPIEEIIEEVAEVVAPARKSESIKVEVSTEKLEKVFNDGFKKLGELFAKPEPVKTETPAPAPVASPEPKKEKTIFDEVNEMYGV